MRRTRFNVILATTLFAMSLPVLSMDEVTIKPAVQPPVIDGVLDDPCWREATVIETLYNLEQPGQTTAAHQIMVTFDDQWLYAAYCVHQPEAQRQAPAHLKHDDFVQRDDCVKLSFDPGTDGAVYYHFKLNRANARREQKVTRTKGQTNGRQDIDNWNIPWRSAVRDNPEGWTAELAVPLALMPPFGKLAQAKINLLITRYLVISRDVAVNIATTERERLSAAPLERSFDEPENFLAAAGMSSLKIGSGFLPYFEKIKIHPYRAESDKYFYDLEYDLRQHGKRAGETRIEYEDRPQNGTVSIVTQTVPLTHMPTNITVKMAVPVTGFEARTGELRLCDAGTGELWQTEPLLDTDMASLNKLFDAYLDRSYYTDEQAARVICRIGLPEVSLKEMKLICLADAAADKPAAIYAEIAGPALGAVSELKIPLPKIGLGRLPLQVQLRQADGTIIFAQPLTLIKRAPHTVGEWKTDHENRVLLHNGKPFFLRGVNFPLSSIVVGTNIAVLERAMREVSELGFNALLYSDGYSKWRVGSGLEPDNTAYLDLAQKYNLFVMPWIESYDGQAPADAIYTDPGGGRSLVTLHFALVREERFAGMTYAERTKFWEDAVAEQKPRFLAASATLKNHPNFLGYFMFDEPVPRDKYDQISSGQELYRQLHETDGYHPVMINYCYLPEGDEYVNWCDVLAVDPYWVPPGRPDRVSRFTAQAWRHATPRRLPVWSVPCPENWSFIYKRPIAPRENLCQTYLALIHGAKGLWYFTYPFRYKFTADGFMTVNRHLDILGPVVMEPAVEQIINRGEPNYKDIQAALFRHPSGGYVVLAANRCEFPVDATFTLSNLSEQEVVRQLMDTNWQAAAQDSSFSEQFEPFGVRAFCYRGDDNKTDAVISLDLTMTPRMETYAAEPLIPVTGRVGKRNLVHNPGFELPPTLPGCPDYWPEAGFPGCGYYFGEPGALAGLDEINPFEGKYSLRVQVDSDKGLPHFASVGFRLAPQQDTPRPFVFSLYMRADREGVTATFLRNGASFGNGKKAVLTTDWARYYKVGEIGQGSMAAYQNSFRILIRPPVPGEKCTVWIDAVQVEQGAEPTVYDP